MSFYFNDEPNVKFPYHELKNLMSEVEENRVLSFSQALRNIFKTSQWASLHFILPMVFFDELFLQPVPDYIFINHMAEVSVIVVLLRITDGVIAIIDNDNVQTSRHYNVTSSITMLYIKPLVARLSNEDVSNAMDATIQATNQNILQHLPDVKSLEIAEVCRNSNEDKLFDQLLDFCCVKMFIKEEESLRLYAASMDIQGLKEDRTYIVIGGTKGLGLNTVKWMASRGKQNLNTTR